MNFRVCVRACVRECVCVCVCVWIDSERQRQKDSEKQRGREPFHDFDCYIIITFDEYLYLFIISDLVILFKLANEINS